jgi:hypothetical protein
MERLSGDTERTYQKLLERLGGPSIVLSMTHLGQLCYTGLYLGTLVAPAGGHMQSAGETLDFLLLTHFPNSVVKEG